MKKKLFSTLFALVLVLSFSLVTAVPTAAGVDPPVYAEGHDFRTGGSGTAEWSTTPVSEGNYSVELYVPNGVADYGRVNLYLTTPVALSDLSGDPTFLANGVVEGTPWNSGPYLNILLDTDSDGEYDDGLEGLVATSADGYAAGWHTMAGGGYYDEDDSLEINGYDGETTPANLAYWQGKAPTATVVGVQIMLGLCSHTTNGQTVYVDDVTIGTTTYAMEPRVINTTASEGFNTIQDAIDVASASDTITVAAGTYTENVNVDESLTLTGASSATVTVDAPDSSGHGFFVTADSVNISGFTVSGATVDGRAGIYLNAGVSLCNIHDNIAVGNWDGIWLGLGSNSNTLTNNNVSGSLRQGFEVYISDNNTFTGNIANSSGRYGFKIDSGSNNEFTNNIANSNTRYGFYSVTGDGGGCTDATFTGNTANLNTEQGFRIHGGDGVTLTGNTFDSNGVSGIRVNEWDPQPPMLNLTIENNIITNNPIGIEVSIDNQPDTDVSTWTVNYNNIAGNTNYGISNAATVGTLDAENNWWGNASGPYHENGNHGLGDTVSDNIDYIPWLDAAYPGGEETYPVYLDGVGYDNIQDAVTAALSGETITVAPGNYTGNITISANITMVSSGGAGATKLTGTGGYPVVTIGDYTVVLDGFNIDPGTDGVYIDDISAGNVVTIEDSIIEGNTAKGINVDCTVYGTLKILNNTITDNVAEGIYISAVDSGGTVSILNNDILGNNGGIVFASVDAGSSVNVHYNSIVDNVCGIDNTGPGTVDATCNWWGDVAGPYIPTNPCYDWTNGSSVSDNVSYMQWAIRIDLVEGWNIVSMPIAVVEEGGSEPPEELESIYYFNSSTQHWGTPDDMSGYSPLDAMYVKATEPISGLSCIRSDATFPSQKAMKTGWNLIGLAALFPEMPVEIALFDAYWGTGETELVGYSKVISPSLNGWAWVYLRDYEPPPGPPLLPTEGYWVFMVNDGVLGGFTETPITEVAP